MREILFRGKRVDNGEWAYGYYCSFKGSSDIFVPFTEEEEKQNEGHIFSAIGGLWHNVIADTVGQFTGLTDKNGKKIFEGDIVHVHDCLLKPSASYHEFDGVVEHRDGSFVIVGETMTHYRWLDYDVTVLGNIHDNPELLEGA